MLKGQLYIIASDTLQLSCDIQPIENICFEIHWTERCGFENIYKDVGICSD